MDLRTRQKAFEQRGLQAPRDLVVLADAQDDETRRWVYATGLAAAGASSTTTRLAQRSLEHQQPNNEPNKPTAKWLAAQYLINVPPCQ